MSQFQVDADIASASTLPSAFYTDAAIFDAAKEKIFARTWQWATTLDHVRVPGQVFPFNLLEGCLDEPLLITRDMDDQVRCLSNVCTHRGNLVCDGAGVEKSLRCRYHGRRFGLDGNCSFMPEFEGVEGFPGVADNLPQIPVGLWRQFYFVNLALQITLEDQFTDVENRVGWMPIQDFAFAPSRARDYLVKAHWALYIDNYLEGFHIPYVHPALNDALDYGSYTTELLQHGNLQLGVAGEGEPSFDLPTSSPDHGRRIGAYYFWLFPNLMLNFYPWGLSVNVVRPLGPALTKVSFLPFVWDESKLDQGAGAALDRVEREDEAIVEAVQKGLRSRFYDRGRYSIKRECGVHQFHRMVAQAMEQA
ncbi:MAG: aromatic ring-hydroxylating dioxygenase subunit alpha [Armatimonadetes bacterium]|nr:aromatic ring-hydroxylating dioxygenase subunit alpha [Armatimonadota bacterium]